MTGPGCAGNELPAQAAVSFRTKIAFSIGQSAKNVMNAPRLDRSKIRRVHLQDADDWVDFWLTKTLDERLDAIEQQRKVIYGYEIAPRLQRVLGITRTKRD